MGGLEIDMPENFYVAARYPSLAAAGEAYNPIREMLRIDEATELSVFRFQLSDTAIVAVQGLEPPASVLEQIVDYLGRSGGQLITLPDDVVAWLYQRRQQRAPETGFTEQHYTRDTGPRYQSKPQGRLRPTAHVTHLPVTWEYLLPTRPELGGRVMNLHTGKIELEIPQRWVGVCDWCAAELTIPIAAIYHFAVEMIFPDGFQLTTSGNWATCSQCQERLRLKEGDTRVAFDAVGRLWRTHGARYLEGYFGDNARQIRVVTFYAEDGPDEGVRGR
jgi:hypothetical protein